jgi:hypothetical protein
VSSSSSRSQKISEDKKQTDVSKEAREVKLTRLKKAQKDQRRLKIFAKAVKMFGRIAKRI